MTLKPSQVYVVLFSLYWAQGLPVGFMTHALPVILRAQGVSLAQIGGFGLLMAPWAIKVLWAPWVDRYNQGRWGHYRTWIMLTQVASIGILIALSFLPIQALNQPAYLLMFFIALLSMNMMGATQDIATDGLAVHLLKSKQQHWGNMFQVLGSRLGFIVGGGAMLWAMDWLTWQATFLSLAGLVFLNTLPILCFQEPRHRVMAQGDSGVISSAPNSTAHSWRVSLQGYRHYAAQNPTLYAWFWVLCSLKVTDGLSGPISKPLLVDLGLSLSQIGIYITMLGAVAALLGAGIASLCLQRIRRAHALLLFSVLKLISLFGFAWLARQYEHAYQVDAWLIYTINAFEDASSALLLVVVLTLVMQYSRSTTAATDFTLQVSIMALVSGVLYTLSGIAGDYLGYSRYLYVISALGVLLLWPIWFWQRQLLRHEQTANDA